MLKAIICDWNRTLFPDEYEEGFFAGLCRRVFTHSLVRGQFRRTLRLVNLAQKCYRLLRRARRDRTRTLRYVATVTRLMNRYALRGLSEPFVARYIDGYARRSAPRLDTRLLEPIREVRQACGVRVGIISSGCLSGIRQTLAQAGYQVDFILANDFRYEGGVVDKFRLTVMKNKAALLDSALAELGVTPQETMYIGDSLQDEECFHRVAWPVTSFWTRPQERERFRTCCGAFTPQDMDDFRRYLLRLAEDRAAPGA